MPPSLTGHLRYGPMTGCNSDNTGLPRHTAEGQGAFTPAIFVIQVRSSVHTRFSRAIFSLQTGPERILQTTGLYWRKVHGLLEKSAGTEYWNTEKARVPAIRYCTYTTIYPDIEIRTEKFWLSFRMYGTPGCR